MYFWNVELLRRVGLSAAADEARERYLRLAAAHREPMENFPSDPRRLGERGVPNYNWGAAVTAMFLWGWDEPTDVTAVTITPAAAACVRARVQQRQTGRWSDGP